MTTSTKITLYCRNSNGQILEWEGKAYATQGGSAMIEINAGLLKGTKTVYYTEVTEGKNIGKSNETNPFEQAVRDLEGRVLKLKRKGYKEIDDLDSRFDIEKRELTFEEYLDIALPESNTDIDGYEKPMKAQQYYKSNGNICIKFPCYGQPKINGFRCTARYVEEVQNDMFNTVVKKVEFKSKNGLTYNILEHIEKEFVQLYNHEALEAVLRVQYGIELKDIIFDGEMYIPNTFLQDISSAVRKRNDNTPKLKYMVFDLAIKDTAQQTRLHILRDIFSATGAYNFQNILKIQSVIVKSDQEAQILTDNWIMQGHEGGVFRDKNAEYQFGKRPQTMVKLKRKESKEFEIIDVVGGDVATDLGIFICLAENGETFDVTPEGTHEQKREYLVNKEAYIGKQLTVEFYERTKRGVPFHAVGITIRDYE